MSLKKWKEEADMPAFVDGHWVDLEDGIRYQSPADEYEVKKLKEAQSSRVTAKKFGGKALNGSVKQKAWAEKIREEKLCCLSAEDAKEVCKADLLNTSKFWITNKEKSAREIVNFVKTYKSKLEEARDLLIKSDEKYEVVAKEYNELTAKWGF